MTKESKVMAKAKSSPKVKVKDIKVSPITAKNIKGGSFHYSK